MDTCPIILDSETLVPVRAVSESFDATVEWNDCLKKVLIFDWDTITENVAEFKESKVTIYQHNYHTGKVDSFEEHMAIPDFGKYVGLDYTEKDSMSMPWYDNSTKTSYDDYFTFEYEYNNDLGTNKMAILQDYERVLEKNEFTSSSFEDTLSYFNYYGGTDKHTLYSIESPKDDEKLYIYFYISNG